MVIAAVKVSDSPEQIAPLEFEAIVIAGNTDELTVIIMLLLEAVVGTAQLEFEVSSQVTKSPSPSEAEVYAALLVPTLFPLTFHS